MQKIGKTTICIKCADKAYNIVDKFKEIMEEQIFKEFKIIKIDTAPLEICQCGGRIVLPFDFYTTQIDDSYMLVLNTICRSCKGYQEVPLPQFIYPINIRDDRGHNGILLDDIGEEKEELDSYI